MCKSPVTIKHEGKEMEVFCGKCLYCRIRHRSEWAMRCLHELGYWDRASFVTLTYQDSCLPQFGSLQKRDLQLFFKRLRKNLNGRKIKYFACGEYGSKTMRPHYHLILFGVGLQQDDKEAVMVSWPYADWTVPAIRRKAFGLVEYDSIRYVAQYVDKKYNNALEEQMYSDFNLETPFRLLSRGIGLNFCLDNAEQITNLGYITLNGFKRSIPRYYMKKLDLDSSLLKDYAIEADIALVEKATGLSYTSKELYNTLDSNLIYKYQCFILDSRKQVELNLKHKIMLKQRDNF
jgi:hypothetical protein